MLLTRLKHISYWTLAKIAKDKGKEGVQQAGENKGACLKD